MAQSRETPLERLQASLTQLENDPSTSLDRRLFEECTLLPLASLPRDQNSAMQLISRLARLLPNLQQDPSPAINLLRKCVESFVLSFSNILQLDPPVDFVAGLNPAAQPYNLLLLALLAKAADSPKDAAHVAGMAQVIRALVHLWLVTEDVGIATRASQVLLALLKVDLPPPGIDPLVGGGASSKPSGQGLVWRRLFGDRDVYGLFYSVCSTQDHADHSISKRAKTVAQARVLDIVPQLGKMSWDHLVRSHHAEIERSYGLRNEDEGLLDFVCSHMVDAKEDVLIHMNLLQFFAELIAEVRLPAPEV